MVAKKKKKVVAKETPVEEPKKEAGVVTRKILKEELLPLQIEGRLKGYVSATGMGVVLAKGKKVNFPKGEATV